MGKLNIDFYEEALTSLDGERGKQEKKESTQDEQGRVTLNGSKWARRGSSD